MSDSGSRDVMMVDAADVAMPMDVQDVTQPTDVPGDVPGDGSMTESTPTMVMLAVDCSIDANHCRRPTDAVLNSTGTTIYFTGSLADGTGAVFSAPIAGTPVTTLAAGGALNFPVSIAISDDDATLYVADLAADGTVPGHTAQGGIFSLGTAPGAPTQLNIMDAVISPAGVAVDGTNLVISGFAAGAGNARGAAGLFRVATAGGAPTALAGAGMFVDPSDVTVGAAGAYHTFDVGNGSLTGRVGDLPASGGPTFALGGLAAEYPGGIAASRDGAHLLVAGWTPSTNRLTWVNADGSAPMPIPASTALRAPTGIGKARLAPVYVVADESGGPMAAPVGGVFVVR